ncbi:MAG: hypothetical protein WC483_00010 [Candidatus Paceibacterota bacterium]
MVYLRAEEEATRPFHPSLSIHPSHPIPSHPFPSLPFPSLPSPSFFFLSLLPLVEVKLRPAKKCLPREGASQSSSTRRGTSISRRESGRRMTPSLVRHAVCRRRFEERRSSCRQDGHGRPPRSTTIPSGCVMSARSVGSNEMAPTSSPPKSSPSPSLAIASSGR